MGHEKGRKAKRGSKLEPRTIQPAATASPSIAACVRRLHAAATGAPWPLPCGSSGRRRPARALARAPFAARRGWVCAAAADEGQPTAECSATPRCVRPLCSEPMRYSCGPDIPAVTSVFMWSLHSCGHVRPAGLPSLHEEHQVNPGSEQHPCDMSKCTPSCHLILPPVQSVSAIKQRMGMPHPNIWEIHVQNHDGYVTMC
eukprot:364188-Chlamydomonas_euryale.AAC.5